MENRAPGARTVDTDILQGIVPAATDLAAGQINPGCGDGAVGLGLRARCRLPLAGP